MIKDTGPKFFYDTEGHIIGKYIFEDAWLHEKKEQTVTVLFKKLILSCYSSPFNNKFYQSMVLVGAFDGL